VIYYCSVLLNSFDFFILENCFVSDRSSELVLLADTMATNTSTPQFVTSLYVHILDCHLYLCCTCLLSSSCMLRAIYGVTVSMNYRNDYVYHDSGIFRSSAGVA